MTQAGEMTGSVDDASGVHHFIAALCGQASGLIRCFGAVSSHATTQNTYTNNFRTKRTRVSQKPSSSRPGDGKGGGGWVECVCVKGASE